MDPFLRFKQPGLESAYSEQASARASRLDATSSLTLLAFFALRVIRLPVDSVACAWSDATASICLERAAPMLGLAYFIPGVCAHLLKLLALFLYPRWYSKHRNVVVAAVRVTTVLPAHPALARGGTLSPANPALLLAMHILTNWLPFRLQPPLSMFEWGTLYIASYRSEAFLAGAKITGRPLVLGVLLPCLISYFMECYSRMAFLQRMQQREREEQQVAAAHGASGSSKGAAAKADGGGEGSTWEAWADAQKLSMRGEVAPPGLAEAPPRPAPCAAPSTVSAPLPTVDYHQLLRVARAKAQGPRWWELGSSGSVPPAKRPLAAYAAARAARGADMASKGRAIAVAAAAAGGAATAGKQLTCSLVSMAGVGMPPTRTCISVKAALSPTGDDAHAFEAAAQHLHACVREALGRLVSSAGATLIESSACCFPGCVHLLLRVITNPLRAAASDEASGAASSAAASPAGSTKPLRALPRATHTPDSMLAGAAMLDGGALLAELQAQVELLALSLQQQVQGGEVGRWVWEASGNGAAEAPMQPPPLQPGQELQPEQGGVLEQADGMYVLPVALAHHNGAPAAAGNVMPVRIVLPPGLPAQLEARGKGLRVVAALAHQLLPLLDVTLAPGEEGWPEGGELHVAVPTALLAELLLVVNVLATHVHGGATGVHAAGELELQADEPQVHGGDVLLGQLPLLVVPAPAAAELVEAFADMVAQEGSASAAYGNHFANMAWDMALALAGPPSEHDAAFCALVADAMVDTFSTAGMLACLQLVLEATCMHGLVDEPSGLQLTTLRSGGSAGAGPSGAAALAGPSGAAALAGPSGAAALASPSGVAAAPTVTVSADKAVASARAERTPSLGSTLAGMMASALSTLASGARATGGGVTAAAVKAAPVEPQPASDGAPPTMAAGASDQLGVLASALYGFPSEQCECAYQLWKAEHLQPLDLLACCGLVLRDVLLLGRSLRDPPASSCTLAPHQQPAARFMLLLATTTPIMALLLLGKRGRAFRGWLLAAAQMVHAAQQFALWRRELLPPMHVLLFSPLGPLMMLRQPLVALVVWVQLAFPVFQQLGFLPTLLVLAARCVLCWTAAAEASAGAGLAPALPLQRLSQQQPLPQAQPTLLLVAMHVLWWGSAVLVALCMSASLRSSFMRAHPRFGSNSVAMDPREGTPCSAKGECNGSGFPSRAASAGRSAAGRSAGCSSRDADTSIGIKAAAATATAGML